uniref:GH18 domain-containing protein n=1 Tax=Stomoxys calcitrans TaxID=35570 RepID=A0A1I8Q978_STOCA
MTCYYDTFSINRLGIANYTIKDLENGLPMCDNIIYGYVGIHPDTYEVITLHPLQSFQFALVKTLKSKYKKVKFILSLGGDKDWEKPEKYLNLLEAGVAQKHKFINSVRDILRKYKFDGFDLAYQLPKAFRQYGNRTSPGSRKTEYHRRQMTKLIENLGRLLNKENFMLSLTVLPNIAVKDHFNVTSIIHSVDFVTVAAFDFSLPQNTPKQAYYLAPLYAIPNVSIQYRQSNVFHVLDQWKWSERMPTKKLNLGIAVFGRTWNTTKTLKDPHMPITDFLNGPAPGGPRTRTPGLLAWPEICKKLPKISKVSKKKYGNYAYRPGFTKRDQGLLITYESPDSVLEKVKMAHSNGLGGVAIFDLTLDDFRGKCRGEKYVMLKAIRENLN